ncbi:uncharacterized protein LOC129643032 isoform X2 [Bubalus kerabau]|nr:uncharacterized protein LOC129643032 isoform X2 [Bubalus carabanensis]
MGRAAAAGRGAGGARQWLPWLGLCFWAAGAAAARADARTSISEKLTQHLRGEDPLILFLSSSGVLNAHVCVCLRILSHFSFVQLFVTLWTVAARLLCPWGFSRPEDWSGLPCPPPGDLPDPRIEPTFSCTGRYKQTMRPVIKYLKMYGRSIIFECFIHAGGSDHKDQGDLWTAGQ